MSDPVSNTTSSIIIPSYENPPINEVVCGMRFHPSDKLKLTHIGLLWNKLRTDYPHIQHAAPIASTKGEIVFDKELGYPLPRVWFINELDDQLVQFQADRFYFNWRRRKGAYPRYTHVIKQFDTTLNVIESFFKESELGDLKPIEYELSYTNHISKAEGWNTIDDLPRIFSDFVFMEKKNRFLSSPAKISWKSEFPLQDNMGRLVVSLSEAIKTEDRTPLLVLVLKVNGFNESVEKKNMYKWFDVAHEWIVRGFTDITTEEAHKIWKRVE